MNSSSEEDEDDHDHDDDDDDDGRDEASTSSFNNEEYIMKLIREVRRWLERSDPRVCLSQLNAFSSLTKEEGKEREVALVVLMSDTLWRIVQTRSKRIRRREGGENVKGLQLITPPNLSIILLINSDYAM